MHTCRTLLAACSVGFWFWLEFSISWCWISPVAIAEGRMGCAMPVKAAEVWPCLLWVFSRVANPQQSRNPLSLDTCEQLGERLAVWRLLWAEDSAEVKSHQLRVHRCFSWCCLCNGRSWRVSLTMATRLQVWSQHALLWQTPSLRTWGGFPKRAPPRWQGHSHEGRAVDKHRPAVEKRGQELCVPI